MRLVIELRALLDKCVAEAPTASFKCSALNPDGPGAEPALKLLIAFLISVVLNLRGAVSILSEGGKKGSHRGCFSSIESPASSEDWSMPRDERA